MRKVLGIMTVLAAVLLLAGCGSADSPKSVAEKAVKCIQNNDYEGYVSLLYITPKDGEDMEAQRKAVVAMLQSKAGSTVGKKGGIKSYEVLSEEITEAEPDKSGESGATAVVRMKIEYGNGDVDDDESIKLRKDADGEWKIDAGK